MNNLKKIEDQLDHLLEDHSLEDIIEDFDLTPTEVLIILFKSGNLDQELLERRFIV